jgi:hypothetical protein
LWPNSQNSFENFAILYSIMEDECPQCGIHQQGVMSKGTFLRGGYYFYRTAGALGVRVLVLNAGLWSPRYNNSALAASAAVEQFQWMAAQLAEARTEKEQVILMSHIPPGGSVTHSMFEGIGASGAQHLSCFMVASR